MHASIARTATDQAPDCFNPWSTREKPPVTFAFRTAPHSRIVRLFKQRPSATSVDRSRLVGNAMAPKVLELAGQGLERVFKIKERRTTIGGEIRCAAAAPPMQP